VPTRAHEVGHRLTHVRVTMTIRCDEDSGKDCHTKDNDNPSGEWIKDDTELPRSVGGGAVEINNITKQHTQHLPQVPDSSRIVVHRGDGGPPSCRASPAAAYHAPCVARAGPVKTLGPASGKRSEREVAPPCWRRLNDASMRVTRWSGSNFQAALWRARLVRS